MIKRGEACWPKQVKPILAVHIPLYLNVTWESVEWHTHSHLLKRNTPLTLHSKLAGMRVFMLRERVTLRKYTWYKLRELSLRGTLPWGQRVELNFADCQRGTEMYVLTHEQFDEKGTRSKMLLTSFRSEDTIRASPNKKINKTNDNQTIYSTIYK